MPNEIHPEVSPVSPSRPRNARLRWWLVAGVLAIAVALVFRIWGEQVPNDPPMLKGQDPDPAWVRREAAVQEQVKVALAEAPRLDRESPHPITEVPSNAQPDLSSAFQISEDHRTYDLRDWKPVKETDGPHTAGVTMLRKLKLVKVSPADRIDFLARTSGTTLAVRCETPKPEAAKVFASKEKPVVRGHPMNEHRLSMDVAAIPVGTPFELVYRTTYWNSLQTLEEQWFGTIGYDGSKVLSMLILFPESRSFQGGGLRDGPANGELKPYDGTQLVFKGAGGKWMYWEVPGPKTGYIYRVDWKW